MIELVNSRIINLQYTGSTRNAKHIKQDNKLPLDILLKMLGETLQTSLIDLGKGESI